MKIKHCSILLICFIIIAALCGSYIYILSRSSEVSIELKKVYGSEDVLKEVTIKGDIGDNYHKVLFIIQNGEVQKEFSYGNEDYAKSNSYTKFSTMNNFDYEYPMYEYYTPGALKAQTDKAEYFVSEFDIYITAVKNEKSEKFEKVENQVIFTVEKKDSSDEICYMGKVGDKLIIIVSRSGYLYADIIDPEKKKLLGEMKIDKVGENLRNDSADTLKVSYYDSTESNGYFILRQSEYNDTKPYYHFYVIDISNLKVVESLFIKKSDEHYKQYNNFYSKVLYKNEIFYLLYQYEEVYYSLNKEQYYPIIKIFAFKNGKRLYAGELVTDISKDNFYDEKIYNAPKREFCNLRME